MNDPSEPATLKDVARVAGVALSTVSAYLNSTRKVSPALQVRIRDAVRELDYIPNFQARNLRMKRAASIGLVVPELANPYFAALAEGIESRLSGTGVTLTLSLTGSTGDREEAHASLLRRARLDGLVVISATGRTTSALLDLIERFPVVLADEQLPSLNAAFVGSDNRRGARSVADVALASGGRRPAIIAGPRSLWTAEARLSGYREALAGSGIEEHDVILERGDYTFASGLAAAMRLYPLERYDGSGPDIVIASNDLMALGVLRHLRRIGASVPEDVVVVGFDDIPVADMITPTLTTVSQPAHDIGFTATDLLLRTIDGEALADERVELPTELRVRESTR
ncbi:LacI family DNA-binding transcriptional regulator [Naasia lichenicola]|uniref:LacI family DNA-binding transcriptional regulator n=1 Tax=Naasia lichenicola TaxID=2565933 RepID=UPI00130D8666|nr:LacI family DNA-binding transcriptional regulator [Naasia lichenicola]